MDARPTALATLLLALASSCGGADPTPTDNVLPTAMLTATPELVTVGQAVTLSAGGSIDSDGVIVAYRFVFADGSPALEGSTLTAMHTFAAPGLYQVTLSVTDDMGGTASASAAVNVSDSTP